jgi:hypothetical protein
MSLLNRPDGVQFVVQPYRERISISKRSVMARRIRLLSEQHGQYVLISPLTKEAVEAVFSRESGYLLGESVWAYFDKSPYLIFCERLSKDSNQVLLVVVRANEVYLDMVIDNDKLRAELVPLMTMQESFRVITYGDVSLSQNDAPGRFVLPKNLVNSFEIAKEPVFKNLPVSPSVQLLTLIMALKTPLLGSRISPLAVGVSTLAILAVVWWIYAVIPPKQEAPVMSNKVAEKVDLAYIDFYSAMKSPSPDQQLNELAHTVQALYALPGWEAANIRYDNSQYHVRLDRQGGSLRWLTQWADDQNYPLLLSASGAEIAVPSHLIPRERPRVIYPLSEVMATLVDELDLLFPEQMVNISDARIFGETRSRTITINLSEASPDTLVLIGGTLGDHLPLSIAAMNVNVNKGLINGSVQLSVWGI